VFGLIVVLEATTAVGAADRTTAQLCQEFAPLLARPGRISEYAIEGERIDDGEWRIRGLDIDGDQVEDEMTRFCPGSGSIVPADPCTLEFKSSSADQTFVLEEQRLYVIRYKSGIYAVAGRAESDTGPFHTDIYSLTAVGAEKRCSFAE
jgi:hypothetical protein